MLVCLDDGRHAFLFLFGWWAGAGGIRAVGELKDAPIAELPLFTYLWLCCLVFEAGALCFWRTTQAKPL